MVTQIIGDINGITIATEDKTVTWDDVCKVDMESYTDECYNEYDMVITTVNKGYYFRFYTRQDTFKDELCKASPTPKKFELCYKDSDNKNCIIEGDIEYLNIHDNINTLYDSYIQVFLRDFKVHEDKCEEIQQAYILKKEDVEQLEKALLTNDYILQPLTQKSNEEEGIMLSENINIQDLSGPIISTSLGYNPDVCCSSSINYGSVTFGDYTFSPKEIGKALKSLVDDYKTKIEENKEDKNMFNKIFNKYKFGKLDTKDIAYSMNGIAFRTSDGSYVVYNKDLTFTNVDNLVMDIPVFVMPVPLSEIKPGDVIVHYGVGSTAFVIVDSIKDTDIFISDPRTRERKNLIPEKSIFGFDFVAKVMTPNTMFAADQSNPFGNMLPFMLMDEDANTDNLGLMMLLGHSSGEASWANQYLPLMLMNKGDNDMFKYMMLMQMMNQNKETK